MSPRVVRQIQVLLSLAREVQLLKLIRCDAMFL